MPRMRLNGRPFWRDQLWILYWKMVREGSRAKSCGPSRRTPSTSGNQRRKGKFFGKAVTAKELSAENDTDFNEFFEGILPRRMRSGATFRARPAPRKEGLPGNQ